MKTIGLIGGMSWESSALYYRLINEETKKRLGGHHNAKSVMVTVDFDEVEHLQHAGEWTRLGQMLGDASRRLERAGADFIVLCTNTMHKLADSITKEASIPLLHIVDATAEAIRRSGNRRVGLLATRFTMEHDFYKERMREKFGLDVLVPPPESRIVVHEVIYEELCHGVVRDESREKYLKIIADLGKDGAQSIILGCTEIELLISGKDCELPAYPSTSLHAAMAVDWTLA